MKPVKPHCPLLIIALANFRVKGQNSINSLMIRAETHKILYASPAHTTRVFIRENFIDMRRWEG